MEKLSIHPNPYLKILNGNDELKFSLAIRGDGPSEFCLKALISVCNGERGNLIHFCHCISKRSLSKSFQISTINKAKLHKKVNE